MVIETTPCSITDNSGKHLNVRVCFERHADMVCHMPVSVVYALYYRSSVHSDDVEIRRVTFHRLARAFVGVAIFDVIKRLFNRTREYRVIDTVLRIGIGDHYHVYQWLRSVIRQQVH